MGNKGYALNKACPELQSVYDACEKSHLDAFKRGEASIDNPCRDEWEDYKQCVMAVWDSKTQDYLQRRAAAKGEASPPPAPHAQTSDMTPSPTAATQSAATSTPASSSSHAAAPAANPSASWQSAPPSDTR